MHARASSEEMRADSRAASIRAPASAGTADLTVEDIVASKGGWREGKGGDKTAKIRRGRRDLIGPRGVCLCLCCARVYKQKVV